MKELKVKVKVAFVEVKYSIRVRNIAGTASNILCKIIEAVNMGKFNINNGDKVESGKKILSMEIEENDL